MYHRKISLERELLKEALKCYEIMEVLEDARVKKTMFDIGPYYPKLVKEFIVNFPKGFNDVGSKEFRKVHSHGHYFRFSSAIINEYRGRERIVIIDHV